MPWNFHGPPCSYKPRCHSLEVSGLGANESSTEASLPEKTFIIEKDTSESVHVATEELESRKVVEEHIPL